MVSSSRVSNVVIAGNLVDTARQRGIPFMKATAQAAPRQGTASLRRRGLSLFARPLTSAPAPALAFVSRTPSASRYAAALTATTMVTDVATATVTMMSTPTTTDGAGAGARPS